MGNFFWKLAFKEKPLYRRNGLEQNSSTVSLIFFENEKMRDYFICFYNSSLHFLIWNTTSDCYHFSISEGKYLNKNYNYFDWLRLSDELCNSYNSNGYIQLENKQNGETKEYYRFFPQKSKSIIDEIDLVLASHYGFTEEELDFIINYDIKYRMGDELNED